MPNEILGLISVSAVFALLWSLGVIIFSAAWSAGRNYLKPPLQNWSLANKIIWIGTVVILIALLANGNIKIWSPYF